MEFRGSEVSSRSRARGLSQLVSLDDLVNEGAASLSISTSNFPLTKMPSTKSLIRPVQDVAFRPASRLLKRKIIPVVQTRFSSNDQKTSPVPPGTTGPNEDVGIPHISEEQAAMDKSMGNTPPDIDQGTPVQDVSFIEHYAQVQYPLTQFY